MIKLFSTFSGVGGFELALQRAIGKENVDIVGYSEIDKFAIQTYEQHFEAKNYGSIVDIDIPNMPDFDLLTGGFPCTDVSVAGKQDLSLGRTVLVEYLLQMLEIKKPKYFVFENVKGLMSKKFTTFRESIFERIRLAGYDFRYKVLNTREHGVPQNRERVFIVGCRDGLDCFEYPEKEELKVLLKDILEDEVDEKFYMTQKQYDNLGYESLKRIYDKIAPTLDTMQGGHRQPKVLFEHRRDEGARLFKGGTYGTIRTIDSGGDKRVFIGHNTRSREFVSSGSKTSSPTLCARDYKYPKQVLKGNRIRKLTPIECERLQSFPDGWTSICSNTQRYKQMGNAVSVNVVEKLFRNLLT